MSSNKIYSIVAALVLKHCWAGQSIVGMSGHVADKGRKRPSPFEGPSSHSHIDILLDDEELEEAFLEPGSSEGPTILPAPLAAVVKESPTTKSVWPALRRSSVSVRKMSPVVGFDPQAVSLIGGIKCRGQNRFLWFTCSSQAALIVRSRIDCFSTF